MFLYVFFSSAMSFKNIFNKINYNILWIIFTVLNCMLSNVISISQYSSFLLLIRAFSNLFIISKRLLCIENRRELSLLLSFDMLYKKYDKFKIQSCFFFYIKFNLFFSFSDFTYLYGKLVGSIIPSMAVPLVSFLFVINDDKG